MKKQLSSYYFRQHMYTMVPRHVREDMEWMAEVGTNNVCIAILEQDIVAAQRNLELLCREADRAGMRILAVPSRWGGLIAGAPKVPSIWTASHPESWVLNADGTPYIYGRMGPLSSVYHEATFEFMSETARKVLDVFPVAGLIWDEVKCFAAEDHCAAARKHMGSAWDPLAHARYVGRFFRRLNECILAHKPATELSLFLQGTVPDLVVDAMAAIDNLHFYGCDGRPWADGAAREAHHPSNKTLLGPGERFIRAARREGRRPLMLIENQDMSGDGYSLMDRSLEEVLRLDVEHWLYYYYPRNCEDPDRAMNILARHFRKLFVRGC